jgi:hypothetical protein
MSETTDIPDNETVCQREGCGHLGMVHFRRAGSGWKKDYLTAPFVCGICACPNMVAPVPPSVVADAAAEWLGAVW